MDDYEGWRDGDGDGVGHDFDQNRSGRGDAWGDAFGDGNAYGCTRGNSIQYAFQSKRRQEIKKFKSLV